MIYNVLAPELAAEKRHADLAEAERHRRSVAAYASSGRPSFLSRVGGIRIRPIRVGDAAMLNDGFARLSDRSRRQRFLGAKPEFTARELRYFTDVDHHDHEALVAITRIGGCGVGVARFIRSVDDPESADVAVTVVDDWHGLGVGTQLVDRLVVRARAEGITRFTALMAADNKQARRLLDKGGAVRVIGRDAGTVLYEVSLTGAETVHTPVDAPVLRHASAAMCVGRS
jgi:GNAT superfamily N-acetyltransferase